MDAVLLRKKASAIHQWKKYNVNSTTTYTWNRWNVSSSTTYYWNRYNYTTTYTWNKYTAVSGWSISSSGPYSGTVTTYCSGIASSKDLSINRGLWTSFNESNPIVASSYTYSDYAYNLSGEAGYKFNAGNTYTIPNYYWTSGYRFDVRNPLYRVSKIVTDSTVNRTPDGEDEPWYDFAATLTVNYRWIASEGYTAGASKGTVSSTNANAYPNGGKHTDGFYYDGRTSTTERGSSAGSVSSWYSSAYPSNGTSGSYWYVYDRSRTSYYQGSTQYSDVTSTDINAYPNGSWSGSYWYNNRTESTTHSIGTYIEDIFSTNPDRYPANAIQDSFWYVYQGQL